MICICAASNKEWDCIKQCLAPKTVEVHPYGECFLSQTRDAVLYSKIGTRKSGASAGIQYLIDRYSPEKIILIGTCAGVDTKHSLCDVIIPHLAIQGDCFDDGTAGKISEKYSYEVNPGIHDGTVIATYDLPLIYQEDCKHMAKMGIIARDMESGAVANVCHINGIDLYIIKGITDFPGNYDPKDERQYLEYQTNVPIVMSKILTEILLQKDI